jgi:hypothetical protein
MARRKKRHVYGRPANVDEGTPVRRGRPLPMGCGLLLAVLTLFMAPATLRLVCVELNRAAYVADELELEFYRESSHMSDAIVEGHIVSTGERVRTGRTDLVGLDRLRALARDRAIVGARAPVWYLPKQGAWRVVDRVNPFRVEPPAEFEGGVPTLAVVAVNALLAAGSILLIRRGVGPKPDGGGGPP